MVDQCSFTREIGLMFFVDYIYLDFVGCPSPNSMKTHLCNASFFFYLKANFIYGKF